MNRGIIYIMTTAVSGIIKIGKTGLSNFEQRMTALEHNGYFNVTALKRLFAIEVDEYDEKEDLLHTIFEKSRVSDSELFALDVNIAVKLLSSFDGTVIYPPTETKESIFNDAAEREAGSLIPNGTYYFKKRKKSDNRKYVKASAIVENGEWTLLKGSVLGMTEDKGTSQGHRDKRANLHMDRNGKLLENGKLGRCTPSFAGTVVMNQSINGWTDWHNKDGQPIEIYRRNENTEKTSE